MELHPLPEARFQWYGQYNMDQIRILLPAPGLGFWLADEQWLLQFQDGPVRLDLVGIGINAMLIYLLVLFKLC